QLIYIRAFIQFSIFSFTFVSPCDICKKNEYLFFLVKTTTGEADLVETIQNDEEDASLNSRLESILCEVGLESEEWCQRENFAAQGGSHESTIDSSELLQLCFFVFMKSI
ncbi:unnamed protein product, partial [Owenia fusiformis]